MAKEIWVFAEQTNGVFAGVTDELLSKAQSLAGPMGGYTVAAVVLGSCTEDLGAKGAEKVYVLDHPEVKNYRADVYGEALRRLVCEYEPEYFFFGATGIGSELAPTVAGLLKTGLAAHCIDLRYNGERLNCMVPAFGGKVVSEIYIPFAKPVMASVRPGILETQAATACEAEVISVDASFLDSFTSAEEFLGFEENEKGGADIESAEVVIAAGRGAASDIAWTSIQGLADKLDGAIAYSRSFIDSGHVNDESCMIGTSGKSVRPKLLINAGVSGATQYVCGITKSKTVISINKSPQAAIYGYSDYGIVGDVDDILPAVLEKL